METPTMVFHFAILATLCAVNLASQEIFGALFAIFGIGKCVGSPSVGFSSSGWPIDLQLSKSCFAKLIAGFGNSWKLSGVPT